MSLLKLKKRPLIRDQESFRDDRLFIVACDDTYAPKQYFGFFRIIRVQVHVVSTPNTDNKCHAKDVLQRLLEIDHEKDDELWMLLDTDHYITGTHLVSFTLAIKEAREKGVHVAISKPCFELWLLLHHVEESCVQSLANANATEIALRNILGQYNKTCLKKEHYLLESVAKAYQRAASIDQNDSGGDIPNVNTSRVYQLWKAIIDKALPSQIPSELNQLRSYAII
jgi:hypothetical protein